MKIEIKNEFPYVLALSIILAVLVVLDLSNAVRAVLSVPFVLFFPGYTLIAALFPARDDLGGIERTALSFGLSIAVVPLLGLILNYTPLGIRLYPILLTLLCFTAIMTAIAIYRRNKLSFEERFNISINLGTIRWRDLSGPDKVLSVVLAGAVVLAVGSIYYVANTPKTGEQFTEFYILGPGGKAEGYPRDLQRNEDGTVILGIVNHEYRPITYNVEVRAAGYLKNKIGPFELNHGEKKEETASFAIYELHKDLKVEFLLFKGGESEPYRTLHLWANTK